jgi:hypothetical protein
MQLASIGDLADPQRGCGVGGRQIHVVAERHDRPLFLLQTPEGRRQLVALKETVQLIGGRPVVMGLELGLRTTTLETPALVMRGIDHQLAEPHAELGRFAQLRQVSPRPEQRFLHGVLGARAVGQEQASQAVEPIDLGPNQRFERSVVAVTRSADELFLQLLHLIGHRRHPYGAQRA